MQILRQYSSLNLNSGHRPTIITIYSLCVDIVSDYENLFPAVQKLCFESQAKSAFIAVKAAAWKYGGTRTKSHRSFVLFWHRSSSLVCPDATALGTRLQKQRYVQLHISSEGIRVEIEFCKNKTTRTRRVFTRFRQNGENLVYCTMNTEFSSYSIFPYVSASKTNLTIV